MTDSLRLLLNRDLAGSLPPGESAAFADRLRDDPELRGLADARLIAAARSLAPEPSITDHSLLRRYVAGTASPDETRRLQAAQDRDPLIAAELADLFALRLELAEFRFPAPTPARRGFWDRVAAVSSLPPRTVVPALGFASEHAPREDWRRIEFPEATCATGVVRFEQGEAIVSLQSPDWNPGVLLRARIRGARTGEERTVVGLAEEDAVPCAEFAVPMTTDQPVEVVWAVVGDLLDDDLELQAELRAAAGRARSQGGIQAGLWHEWAAPHLASPDPLLRDLAREILDPR